MLANCVHCQASLQFTEAQLAKIEAALAKLQPGKHLRFNCPHCSQAIDLLADGSAAGVPEEAAPAAPPARSTADRNLGKPMPPDTGWLAGGHSEKSGMAEDIPLALILVESGALKTAIAEAFVAKSYRPVFAKSVERAMGSMRFVRYAAVVFQPEFEGKPLNESLFHNHMREMEMMHRRATFYVLVGPQFQTLYDLEALTCSANLVVNEKDAPHLGAILNKSLQDYQDLFGPFLAVLKEHGKL